MKLFRRILAALAMAATAAAGIRLRGRGGVPPQHGGWRPLDLPDVGDVDVERARPGGGHPLDDTLPEAAAEPIAVDRRDG